MASGFQFEDLMSMAEHNAMKGEKKIKQCTAPQFNLSAPKVKKQTAAEKKLSDGVRKFLMKKEEEEKQKAEEERVKKEKLMELRRQDKKANKRVSSMLRMTKSANKSCMDDAKDSFRDSLAQQEEVQPDEDDYGYVSQYSQEMHKKMMDKYRQMPVSKPTSRPPPAPIPTSQSLPRQRQKSSGAVDDSYNMNNDDYESYQKSPEESNVKKKKPPPDIMNFQDLLALANEKAQNPIQAKPKLKPTKEKEVFEFGRPMTAKEKAAYLKEKALKERVAALHDLPMADRNGSEAKANGANSSGKFKIPSVKKKDLPSVLSSADIGSSSSNSNGQRSNKSASVKLPKKNQESTRGSSSQNIPPSKLERALTSTTKPSHHSKPPPPSSMPMKRDLGEGSRPSQPSARPSSSHERPPVSAKRPAYPNDYAPKAALKQPPQKSASNDRPKLSSTSGVGGGSSSNGKMESRPQLVKGKTSSSSSNLNYKPPNKDVERQRHSEPSKPPARPPPSKLPQERRSSPPPRRPPPGVHPRMGGRPMPKPGHKRPIIDSDEEYDSEMDDFIDDSGEQLDLSSVLRDLYGYDRAKFRHIDDEDIQESSYAEQRREEARSARIGRQEDLEDMRLEEEEKKQAMMMRKKMRR